MLIILRRWLEAVTRLNYPTFKFYARLVIAPKEQKTLLYLCKSVASLSKTIQFERALHQEVAIRLTALKPKCVWISPPNGFFIPSRSKEERDLARRLVSQMKKSGMITVGAPDWIFLWD